MLPSIYLRLCLVWSLTALCAMGRAMVDPDARSPSLQQPSNMELSGSLPANYSLPYGNLTVPFVPQSGLVNFDRIVRKTTELARKRYKRAQIRFVSAERTLRYRKPDVPGPNIQIAFVALVKPWRGSNYYVSLIYNIERANSASPTFELYDQAKVADSPEIHRSVFEYNSTTVTLTLLEAGDLLRKQVAFDKADVLLWIPPAWDSSSEPKPYWLLRPHTETLSLDWYVVDMQAEAGQGAVIARLSEEAAAPGPLPLPSATP